MTDTPTTPADTTVRPPLPGNIILSSGSRYVEGIEVPAAEFAERGVWIADLIGYLKTVIPYLDAAADGLPTDADDFIPVAAAAARIKWAADQLLHEVLLQGFCGELIAGDVLLDATGEQGPTKADPDRDVPRDPWAVSRTTLSRVTSSQRRIDGGNNRKRKTWVGHEVPDHEVPDPPAMPEPTTFDRIDPPK